ncbi:peptidase [Streptomyces spiralis]|uniref:Peptidase n=1 Tax=Streptomyces spiralis TaxID=66376 RepID=A0A919A7Z4_9ACTN|nr:S8 family serine peptidase [Streptomyces spiralis]GHE92040.1 peptidase [Streptomyces spiralis]
MTLITGDKVTVTPGTAGSTPEVNVRRTPGATGSVRVSTEDGNTYVYPDDAVAYIAAGRLDKELFDVTQLIAQGYDDKHASELPLILTRTTDSATLKPSAAKDATPKDAGPALPGTRTTLSLPTVHGEAVRTHRSKAAAFWSALTGPAQHKGKQSAGRTNDTPNTAAAPPFTAGVDKVWLDGRAKATLADTTAQIGAPAAWASGGTGAGVRVAVLDTGVDTTHPDLEPRIVASKSFVPGEDITDRDGHGTHTASTVAGTGAASDGKERGVAPDADLLVGKVLDDTGSGQDSWIIAGMQWAAETEHAKVISMSLGTSVRHGQNDPLSQALNKLSAETGALFVVASGNLGNNPYSITSPATADAALSVGAVDSSDQLASFSSTGPRLLDDGLKPDITAPGVDVLAARSQYMNGGEGYYRSESGTSMAAPHVAGAAVLLARKHPEWTAQQIKNALMSTSVPTPDYSPYQAGTGRVNVPGAYYTQVFATGSVDAGLVRWSPTTQPQPITREITYTNVTADPVTLDLSVDPGSSPAAAFALGADHVTVPAQGTAQVEVVVDPDQLTPGLRSAQITARFAGGAVHTVVGVSVESEKYGLTIHMKDRAGRPMSGVAEIRGESGASTFVWVPEDGTVTSRWAPGSYTVLSFTDVEGLHGPHSLGEALLIAPEVELTSDQVVELDASQARQVKVATPKPTTVVDTRIDVWRSFTMNEPAPGGDALYESVIPSAAYDSLWALPTKGKVKKGSFVFTTRIRATQTPLAVSYGSTRLDDALVQPGSKPLPDGTSRLDAVFAGTGSTPEYADLSARGKAVVVRSSDSVSPTDQAAAATAAGAAMLLVVNEDYGRRSDWYGDPDTMTTGQVPVASVTLEEGEALIAEIAAADKTQVRLSVEAHPSPRYLYDLADYHVGEVPEDPSPDTDPRSLARIDLDFALPPGKQGFERRSDYPPYEWPGVPALQFGTVVVVPFQKEPVAPGPRTDWVSAKDGVRWQQFATLEDLEMHADTMTYEPGSEQQDHWFGPVVRPRMLSDDVLFRNPDGSFGATIEGYGDAGTAHGSPTGTQLTSFYEGDRQLSLSPYAWVSAGDLAPEKLPYRLVVDTTGLSQLSPYSTTTRTEWRFTSGAVTESQQIPLVQLDYDTDLDLQGRADRRTGITIRPTVLGSSAAKDAVSSLGLEISYDDGKTWQRDGLKEKQGAWQASLSAPPEATYVSIRVTAKQQNGGGVTQTVIRAFGLK